MTKKRLEILLINALDVILVESNRSPEEMENIMLKELGMTKQEIKDIKKSIVPALWRN